MHQSTLTRKWPRPRASWWLALLAIAVASCSAQGRYRVLDFFFDGVPDPSKPPEEVAEVSAIKMDLTQAERVERLATRVPVPEISTHAPVEQRLCHKCHIGMAPQSEGGAASTSFGELPMLITPLNKLCAECHEVPEEAYVHGPVATRQCQVCHLAHRSIHPHLLRASPVKDLCKNCHADGFLVTTSFHDSLEEDCIVCHDPHGSDREFLLRPEYPTRSAPSGDPQKNEE